MHLQGSLQANGKTPLLKKKKKKKKKTTTIQEISFLVSNNFLQKG